MPSLDGADILLEYTQDKIVVIDEDGVLVDPARAFKHRSCNATFLVGVVDEEYPTDPQFNRLFSSATMKQLDGYPTVTSPSSGEILDTFPTKALSAFTTEDIESGGEPSIRRRTESYYTTLYARMLATGCRAGTSEIYFCTYKKDDTGTSSRQQQSRFLTALESKFEEIPVTESDTIRTSGEVVSFALNSVDHSLDTLRQSLSDPEMVKLDEIEAEFGGVQTLLKKEPPEELAPALQAHVDFAQGRIRNE